MRPIPSLTPSAFEQPIFRTRIAFHPKLVERHTLGATGMFATGALDFPLSITERFLLLIRNLDDR